MSVKAKYQPVLDLGEQLNLKDTVVTVEGEILKVKGQVQTQYEKNLLWDKIKEIGGQVPVDLKANITVADESVHHWHTVKSGESLSKISKKYYGDPMKYKKIFEANTNILKNPDIIQPGQVLAIPK